MTDAIKERVAEKIFSLRATNGRNSIGKERISLPLFLVLLTKLISQFQRKQPPLTTTATRNQQPTWSPLSL
jgi:hypothetical protein